MFTIPQENHHFYRWYDYHSQMGGLWHCFTHITKSIPVYIYMYICIYIYIYTHIYIYE
jgi:hypothetical protein